MARYVLGKQGLLSEHFDVQSDDGETRYRVDGHDLSRVSLNDLQGQELAAAVKVPDLDQFDVSVGGRPVGRVHSMGFLRVHYQVDLEQGVIETRAGDRFSRSYTLLRDGREIGDVDQDGEGNLFVDVVEAGDAVTVLAIAIAIYLVRKNPGRYSDNPFGAGSADDDPEG